MAMSGRRLLTALGFWLLASAIIGTASFFAARRFGGIDAEPIIVAEVYALLITSLVVVVRSRTALGLVGCRSRTLALRSRHVGAPTL